MFHQCTEAKFSNSEETSGNQCVENSARYQTQTAAQHSQIIVSTMQNYIRTFQRTAEWLEIEVGQWIDNTIIAAPGVECGWNADLKQTQLFPIRMQTVRFSIDRDTID